MPAHALRPIFAMALLAGLASPAATDVKDLDCQVDASHLNLFRDRKAIIARYEQLPDRCLKTLFSDCSSAARQTMLDGSTAAVCSIGYEALLRRSFGGDFEGLLAWWRAEGRLE